MNRATRFGVVILLTLLISTAVHGQVWVEQGPGPITNGGLVENIVPDSEVVGAIHAVAAHPTDANVIYIGAANGGIWRTGNAAAVKPNWVPQLGLDQALGIGDLTFDPTDPAHLTLVAGAGRFSSFGQRGPDPVGVWRTTDGTNWTLLASGGIVGRNITGIAARGPTIVVSADALAGGPGIWRSTDTGGTFTQISGGAMTGLPAGASFDLAEDPGNPMQLFTNAGANGIYRSDDFGATWTKKSNAAMDAVLTSDKLTNVEISVGTNNNVYVAIVIDADGNTTDDGRLAGLFRSPDDGQNWFQLDVPTTTETGGTFGIHPGNQGDLHLSIAADPTDDNLVYIGGDRQPRSNDPAGTYPNSINSNTSSGRLFRVDASQPLGSQFSHITHSHTTSNTAPHSDSRDLAVDAGGNLIEVDDGGIYHRTTPKLDSGDWVSINGDLKDSELHNSAWDAVSKIIIGGTIDNDSPQQVTSGGVSWTSTAVGDGGDVAVDDTSTPGVSTRYSSRQALGGFHRQTYGPANNFMADVFPPLTVIGGGPALTKQFTTPVLLNGVDPHRLVIGGNNTVYESLDQGDTITAINPLTKANANGREPIAYGAAGNPEMLYVGSNDQVFIRDGAAPDTLAESLTYPGKGSNRLVAGIVMDPADPLHAFVNDTLKVFHTPDGGATWSEITGNLQTLNPGTMLTIAYSTANAGGSLVVGANNGVFIARGPGFSNWSRLGTGLPRAPVFDLEYDPTDKIILAGLLGRGAWTITLEERDPVDVALVLDLSGSMLSPACPACDPKLQVLKDAVEIFVQLWKELDVPGDRMAVKYFRTNIQEFAPGGTQLFPFDTNADAVIIDEQGQTTVPTNLTAMGGGIQTAVTLLGDATRPRNVIVFTDGMQNVNPMVNTTTFEIEDQPGHPSSGVTPTVPATDLNATLGRKVSTIGVGATAPFVDLLSQIASETGGVFKLTTAPDDDLRQFYVEQLVDVLRDFSPQLVGYRHGTVGANGTSDENFNTNGSARKVILQVSWKRGATLDFTVEKDGVPVNGGHVTTGAFYKIFSIDVPAGGITAAGTWRVRVIGRPATPYEAGAIVDEEELKYDFSIGGSNHTTGQPLPLSVKLTFAGVPVSDASVTARVLAPRIGLGTLLAAARTPSNLKSLSYEPQASDAQRKYQLLLNDDAFRAQLQPKEQIVTLQHTGGGNYTASFNDTAMAGPYTAVFTVTGSRPDVGAYARTESRSVSVRFGVPAVALSKLNLVPRDRIDGGQRFELHVRPVDASGNVLGPDYGDRVVAFVNGTRVPGSPRDLLDGTYVFTLDAPANANVTVTVLEQPLFNGPITAIPAAGGGRIAFSAHLGSTISLSGFPSSAGNGYLAEVDLEYRTTSTCSIEGVLGHYDFGSDAINGFTLFAKKYIPLASLRAYGAVGPGVFKPESGGGTDLGASFAAGLNYAITPRIEFDAGAVYTHVFDEDIGWLGLRVGVKVTF